MKTVATGMGYGAKEQEYIKFSFTYFFWDNNKGKIIGFAELSDELEYGSTGISERHINKMVDAFCESVISSLKSIR